MTEDDRLVDLLAAAIAQVDPTIAKRIETDPQAHLDLLALTARADAAVGDLLHRSVVAARAAGWSWEAVGTVLGMSRQAAHQRFGGPPGDDPAYDDTVPGGVERRRLVGLLPMDEITTLDLWGRHGWRAVAAGPGYHDIEHTTVVWEHERAFVGTRRIKTLEGQGWQRVGGTWFPWVYLERRRDETPLPGEPE